MENIKRLPIRCLNGQWQVLLNSPVKWQPVNSEQEANLIARSRPLAEAVNNGVLSGPDVAGELGSIASCLREVLGGTSIIERYCRSMAKKAIRT